MNFFYVQIVVVCFILKEYTESKYVEGHIKTLEDWVFVARFCFLSGKGRYEYNIEFERRVGEPQLLLYYDDKTQWPAVYKTGKTCPQKLSVLSAADNQIVTLSARSPHNILSGCALRTSKGDTDINEPKQKPRNPLAGELNYTYFDQFLKTSTFSPIEFDDDNFTFSSFNLTELFNISEHTFVPIGTDMGFENEIENNTSYKEFTEELFGRNHSNLSPMEKLRAKRAFPRLDRPTLIVTCRSAGGFLTARERWWYIAISNCGSKSGIDIKYKFRMTNGPPGDFWHEHFSADEMYIPPILLTESLIYTFLLLAIFICAVELKTRHLFHCTYRLFAFSAFLQYMGVLFAGVAYAKYAVSGIGPHNTIGTLFQGASEVVYLAMLLLMAKGYTITRARLSTCSTVKLTIFINIYIVVYISLFIYREEVFDPGEVLNLYESPAGLGLAGLRCGSWGAFLISTASTTRKFPEKANFYYPFGILGSLWILGGPLLTFLGIAFFDPWVRESVMCGVLAILSISGHLSFLWLTWPSRANTSFPYHVRTNHVGVMSAEDDGADYPRHIYEPSITDTNVIIPLSRRTEDLLNGVYNQYLREKEYYNSSSTPHSHVSFPPEQAEHHPVITQENFIREEREESQHDSGNNSYDGQSNSQASAPPNEDGSIKSQNSQILKRNPFLVNGVRSPPNKIILEPINPPVCSSANNDVPRHLFTARNPL